MGKNKLIKGSYGILVLAVMSLLFSTLSFGATSIELTTGNFINVFGNLNLSGNNLINAGNVSIKGNLSVDGNFSVDGNTLFVDATSNNVGIGTTSPNYLLQVASGTDGRSVNLSNVLFVNGSSGKVGIGAVPLALNSISLGVEGTDVGIYLRKPNAAADAKLWNIDASTNNTLRFRVIDDAIGNGNDWLSVVRSGFTISSVSFPNGNVGIGTTSPAANLEVSNGSSASKLIISTTNTGADTATIRLKNSAGAYNDIVEISHGSGRTDFRDGNGLNVMTIDMSDAQLGINDTSPDATLEVGGGTFMVSSTSSGDGDRLIVNSAGNVGIGTTGPLSKLSIGGAGTASADLYIANSNIATIYLDGTTNPSGSQLIIQGRDATVRTTTLSQDSSGLFTINNSGTAGTEFSITTGGNVGIGKTSPNAKLDVAGTVNASSFSTGGFSGSNGRIVAFDAANNDANTGVNLNSITIGKDLTTAAAWIQSYGGAGTPQMLQLNPLGGNVGIGTTNPAAKLEVVGSNPTLRINATADTSGTLSIYDGAKPAVNIGDAGSNSAVGYTDLYDDTGTIKIHLQANDVAYFNSGNVGIGTTTPASTLTITGNFSATGTKSAVVNTTYGIRKLYAMESPDIRFYDEGRARLNNGIANISLDPIFIETVEPDYNVHLTPEGKTLGIYVAEKAKEYFIVKSYVPNSNVAFTWQISAIRKGYRDVRLDLERKEDIEIVAVIDEDNKVTDVQISENVVFENNSNVNAPNLITGNAVDKNDELSQNKITINSDDEDDVIEEMAQKTKIGKDKIKRAITFKRKEPSTELLGEPEIAFLQPQLTRITEVNGSIIMRLG